MSGAYYNDSDPFCAAWLRELIKANLIVPGEVDERSIEEVKPEDLRGFTQCHFFAGIGVWSYALRLAGWPDSRPVWTGSCPCPSFSAAGQGKGFEDPRHLWPCWFGLIRESRPPTIFGEQADKAIGFGWLDLVQTDLEAAGYAVGATVFGAHSVGAPHIRQRLYFVADSEHSERRAELEIDRNAYGRNGSGGRGVASESSNTGSERIRTAGRGSIDETAAGMQGTHGQRQRIRADVGKHSETLSGAESMHAERRALNEHGEDGCDRSNGGRSEAYGIVGTRRQILDGINPSGEGLPQRERIRRFQREALGSHAREAIERTGNTLRQWRGPGWLDPITARSVAEAGATRGYWGDCDWWYGRDGKYRPIGAGLFPLVAGATGRMGKLRGYGNAICAPQAQAFIEAYMSI